MLDVTTIRAVGIETTVRCRLTPDRVAGEGTGVTVPIGSDSPGRSQASGLCGGPGGALPLQPEPSPPALGEGRKEHRVGI